MTCFVIVWLELKHSNRKQEWELLSKKASDWLTTEIGAEALVNQTTDLSQVYIQWQVKK
jgi:hypothetical protein